MAAGRRLASIDVLKGVAILAVIAQHALPGDVLDAIGSDLHLRQAVPLLFVLMGYNAVRSSSARPPRGLGDAYGRRYLEGRFWRIFLPFAVVWLLALVFGVLAGDVHLGPLTLIGVLPVAGPGTYFVTILFAFTLLYPAWWLLFRRRPLLVTLAAVALDAAFELVAGSMPSLQDGGYPYGYDASLLRYAAAIAVGMWLGIDDERAPARRRAVLALAPLSLAFLVALQAGWTPGFLVPGFGVATSLVAVPWAAALMLAGLALWPARGVRATGWLEALGRASYHVFLVQIVWFGLLPEREPWRLPFDALVCGAVGWALYRVLPARWTPALRGPRLGVARASRPAPRGQRT